MSRAGERPHWSEYADGRQRWEQAPFQFLAEIEQITAEIEHQEQAIYCAVMEARQHGASWGQIGSALGISKQAAKKRYARTLF